jgi:alpha-beta hydrolase superfamily lysophospholipase
MKRLALILLLFSLSACTPLVTQQAGRPPLGFTGPHFAAHAVISFDGTRLGLTKWEAKGEPWAVIVALHGMNDYANAFHIAGPAWAKAGVTTYAYDQRGFGRSPHRGVWADESVQLDDLRTVVALARQKHPNALIAVVGESMGGSVAAVAFATENPPAADRLVLLSPGVWGWESQPLPYRALLWLAANFTASKVYTPPHWLTSKITPTDNREELIAMGRDKLMIWGARSDAIYGLVRLMGHAAEAVGHDHVPTLYCYGKHDQIIPKEAAFEAVKGLTPQDRSAYYAHGYHLLTRDKEGPIVIADVLAFLKDPQGPLPSGAPPIPGADTPPEPQMQEAAGLVSPAR